MKPDARMLFLGYIVGGAFAVIAVMIARDAGMSTWRSVTLAMAGALFGNALVILLWPRRGEP